MKDAADQFVPANTTPEDGIQFVADNVQNGSVADMLKDAVDTVKTLNDDLSLTSGASDGSDIGEDDGAGSAATCPDDVAVLHTRGVTEFPDRAVEVVSQDTSSVTVRLNQQWSDADTYMSSVFYQYRKGRFGTECHEDKHVMGGDAIAGGEITVQCEASQLVALLNVCVVD